MASGESAVRALYRQWIASWNRRDAAAMAAILDADCDMVGFDGSPMKGRKEIVETLGNIFRHHTPAKYVCLERSLRLIVPSAAVLRADVGMVPADGTELNPAVNAIQTLVAVERGGDWLMTAFQNTPAAFHGRPEMAEKLSAELRQRFKQHGLGA